MASPKLLSVKSPLLSVKSPLDNLDLGDLQLVKDNEKLGYENENFNRRESLAEE